MVFRDVLDEIAILKLLYSYETDYVHAVLFQRLKMTAVRTTERLHERCFHCAAAVTKSDCMSAAEATLGAAGTLQESYCKIAT